MTCSSGMASIYWVLFFGHVATANSVSRYFRFLAQKLANVCNCHLPYSAPYFRFDHLIRKFETPYSYSNIYTTRCNVTQFIISGNCSTCFGWFYHPSSEAQTTVPTAYGTSICHTVISNRRYSGR
jgi:hypothetical protein